MDVRLRKWVQDRDCAVFLLGWWMGVFAGVFGEKLVQNVVFLW
jgi:hypothetical protein